MSYTTTEVGSAVVVELDRPAPIVTATRMSPQVFRRRFSKEEKDAIYAAAMTQPLVRCYLDDVAVAEYIDVADAYTIQGLNDLEAAGLIAPGRAAEIAAP